MLARRPGLFCLFALIGALASCSGGANDADDGGPARAGAAGNGGSGEAGSSGQAGNAGSAGEGGAGAGAGGSAGEGGGGSSGAAGAAGAAGSAGTAGAAGAAGGAGAGAAGAAPVCGADWAGPFLLATSGFDLVNAVTVLNDGRVALGGFEQGNSLEPLGDSKGVVVVLSKGGAELDRHVIDRPGVDSVEAIAEVGSSLVVAGRTQGKLGGASAGLADVFVGRIEKDSISFWQWGNERPQHPRRMAVRADGSSLVLAGLDDVFVPTNYVEDWENPLALEVKLDGLGPSTTPLWASTPRTPMTDALGAVAVSGAGATFLGGSVSSGPQRGSFVARLDASGQEIWRTRLTTVSGDATEAMAFSPDGSLVVAGATMGPLGGQPLGGHDAFVAWLDPSDGSLLRAVHLGTPGAEWVGGLIVTGDGTVLLAGETAGSFGDYPAPTSGFDVFVAAFPPGGAPPRIWQGGTSGDDVVTGLAQDACGRLYVSGGTLGSFGGKPSAGAFDGFVLQLPAEPLSAP